MITNEIVYLSGPYYAPEEKQSMAEISELLEDSGYETYLSYRDGIELDPLVLATDPRFDEETIRRGSEVLRKATFALEVYQIVERCDCLVFNMNGRAPDEGGVFRTSIAFATGKPVVIYKLDFRSPFYGRDNAMVTGLSHRFATVGSVKKIPRELKRAMREIGSRGINPYRGENIPPLVRVFVDVGRDIWEFIEEGRPSRDDVDEYLGFINKLTELCERLPSLE